MTRTIKHVLDSHGAGIRKPHAIDLLGGRRMFLEEGERTFLEEGERIFLEEGLGWHPHLTQNLE